MRRLRVGPLLLAVLVVAGACSFDTLGGREKCWDSAESRMPSLWRGVLRIDPGGARLETPEGDVIPLLAGALDVRLETGELVRGSDVVARAGDDVTLFGGAGGDGALRVCAMEEKHS